MKPALALIALLMLAGCGNTSVLRVVEYHGGNGLMALRGDGIAVHQSGEFTARVEILYLGERGSVKVKSHAVPDRP
jgi:hypothetical protein